MEPLNLRSPRSDALRPRDPQSVAQGYQHYLKRKRLFIAALAALVLILIYISLMSGSSKLSFAAVNAALIGRGDAFSATVLWTLRMPHVLCALIGGAALALAGCVFQAVLRNPLASASTLGIAQGAAFGASIALIVLASAASAATSVATSVAASAATIGNAASAAATTAVGNAASASYDSLIFANPLLTAACAFAGALTAALAILGLSRLRSMTPESIVLAGVAISALFSGATALIQYFADDSQVAAVVFWTFGSLRRVGYRELALMAASTAACAAYFFLNRWNYNAMESGESSAISLGTNTRRLRLAGMLLATVCASSIIAFCGSINFIGLLAPHIVRRLIGGDYRFLLPASALCGSALLLASDLIAGSLLSGVILPIGAITSLLGAPLFIWLLMKGLQR